MTVSNIYIDLPPFFLSREMMDSRSIPFADKHDFILEQSTFHLFERITKVVPDMDCNLCLNNCDWCIEINDIL